MVLGINTGGSADGDFLPLLTYNAKAGRLKTSARVETAAGWEKQERDVSFDKPSFIMDMANIEVGWLLFRAGQAPIKATWKPGQPALAMPVGAFGNDDKGKPVTPKQGFVMRVMGQDSVVREFASNAGSVTGPVDVLHTAYEVSPNAAAGMLPVVQFTGATERKNKHGSNFEPDFAIVKWVPRPAALGAAPLPVEKIDYARAEREMAEKRASASPPPSAAESEPLPF